MRGSLTLTVACCGLSLACGLVHGATLYQDLHDFAGGPGDGDTSYSDLVADSEGRLYGITYFGGSDGAGTLFRVTLPTTKTGHAGIEILHSFQPGDGVTPVGGVLIGADGGLYGATNAGGAHNGGTVYRVDPVSLALTVLHNFNSGATPRDGSAPLAGLTAGPAGLLYGTTSEDGPRGGGTVFAISPQGDAVSYAVIYAFGAANDANHPVGGRLVSTGQRLFGTTIFGGRFDLGTVFELTRATSGKWHESGLYQFGTNVNDVTGPGNGVVRAKSGVLFGCAPGGNLGHGAVFAITPGTGGLPLSEALIYNFGADASDPVAAGSCAMTIDRSGRLIGTSNGGGANSSGTIFELTPAGAAWSLDLLYSFGIRTNGDAVEPGGAVIEMPNGYYVGTTPVGGANDKGAVYRMKP